MTEISYNRIIETITIGKINKHNKAPSLLRKKENTE